MRNGKIIICVFTTVLLVVSTVAMICADKPENSSPFYVTVSSETGTERIHCWKNENGEYYVFLPSYADLSQAKIYLDTDNTVTVDGVKLKNGMLCKDFETSIPYNLSYSAFFKSYNSKVTFLSSGNVATMYITTQSGSMEYIHAKKNNKEKGTISLYDSYGNIDHKGELASIKGRGNYTWDGFDKKPYNLELSDDANLLGMGLARKWVLLANADDSSNLRNKIVYDFADSIGLKYSPNSEWVDLYLNGEYAGLYLLCERNEVHSERIDISPNGSFLVSLELESRLTDQKRTYISTESGQALRVHYPLINNNESLSRLSSIWQSVENAILAEDGIDPDSGKHWNELIDTESWAKKYLIEEIFGNYDASCISQFFYYDNNSGKIYAGPVWDFDHSIGSKSLWQLENPQAFFANRLEVKKDLDTPWFHSLYKQEEFYNRTVELYKNDFLPLLNGLFSEGIHDYASQISKPAELNRIRWFSNQNNDVFAEAKYISDYMKKRLVFLESVWCDSKEYCIIRVDNSFGLYYAHLAVSKGERLEELPCFDNTEFSDFIGWYYADTDEPFDINKPICEDTAVYAKWQDNKRNRMDDLVKLIPVVLITVIFIVLFIIEIKRIRGNR